MQIAQVLAGYTLGGADLLRRAMGKKKPEEMAKQRSVFVEGATSRGVAAGQAAHIFDLMEKFAGYGFNKSHSAAYALLSYQTAWLKAHYPAAFMAAVLSADMDHTDKVVTLIDECAQINLDMEAPHVNHSMHAFTVAGERSIRYGLGAIKGVGAGAVEALIAERTAQGPFAGLEDLCRRLDLTKVNRRVLEALVRSGSLDGLGANRATMMSRLDAAMQLGEQVTRANAVGQEDFFGLGAAAHAGPVATSVPEQPDFSESVRLTGERETLGLYLTGHPIDRFLADLPRFVTHRIGDLVSDRPVVASEAGRSFRGGKPATVAGLVTEVRRRGTRVAVVLDDRSGRIEVDFFEDVFQQHRELIAKDALLVVEGQVRFDEFIDGWRLAGRRVTELDRVREQVARRIVIKCPADSPARATLPDTLASVLAPWRPGPCQVSIDYEGSGARGVLTLGKEWNVRATRELLEQLELLAGRDNVGVRYGPLPSVATMTG